jgi:glycosyltransferase involved in cell wall biosynthesis
MDDPCTELVAQPLVSVVIPFHNTAEYLSCAIESVLSQEYPHFELILVDNRSTDGSTAIAERYAAADDRITLAHTDTLLPQVPNFSAALERISPASKYTKMCLADDWLHPRCLSEMVRVAESDDDVAIVSSYSFLGSELTGFGMTLEQVVFTPREVGDAYFRGGVFPFGSPTTVMYRSTIVRERKPFFAEGRLHEDTEACLEILSDHPLGYVHQMLSWRRVDERSQSGRRSQQLPRDLDFMINVSAHAQHFFDAPEYRRCLRDARAGYYRALARRALMRTLRPRRDDFWEYHRSGLATAGMTLERRRLLTAVAIEFAVAVTSPIDSLRQLRRRGQ